MINLKGNQKMRKIFPLIFIVVAAWLLFGLLRPLPAIKPDYSTVKPVESTAVDLPWPATGQAAIGAVGQGLLSTHGNQQPMAIASVAKVITALAVLKQKPLASGQQGPIITLDDTDVGYYQSYVSQGGSVAKVTSGESISEYQALQTMLLPSANNMADSLARWAFGSPAAYKTYANSFVLSLGLTQTTVADTSGFSAGTTSTAKDLVNLGLAALKNPVLTQIVGQTQAVVPEAGTIKNTNWLLGNDGFVGIKTGNTDEAGGVYLFASDQNVGTQKIQLVGAVIGASSLQTAVNSGKALADGAVAGFKQIPVVQAGEVFGTYKSAWGVSLEAIAEKDIDILTWQEQKIIPAVTLSDLKVGSRGQSVVGKVSVTSNDKTVSVPIITNRTLAKPSISWRLTHLYNPKTMLE